MMQEYLGAKALSARTSPYGRLYVYVIRGVMPGAGYAFRHKMLAAWEEDGVTELIFEEPYMEHVLNYLNLYHPRAEFLWEGRIDYDNWEAGRPIVPTHAAGFLVCQSWNRLEPAPCEESIILDPGLSFGTGLHPTTQDCLGLLRRAFEISPQEIVLDIGCGSGILSIAALKLGASFSTAVDYSLLAVNASKINAELNGLSGRIGIVHGDALRNTHHPAGLMLCNINFSIVEELLKEPGFSSREWILFSGVNPRRQHTVFMDILLRSNREIVEVRNRSVWYSYLTRKA